MELNYVEMTNVNIYHDILLFIIFNFLKCKVFFQDNDGNVSIDLPHLADNENVNRNFFYQFFGI